MTETSEHADAEEKAGQCPAGGEEEWVACDECNKWRKLPKRTVDSIRIGVRLFV